MSGMRAVSSGGGVPSHRVKAPSRCVAQPYIQDVALSPCSAAGSPVAPLSYVPPLVQAPISFPQPTVGFAVEPTGSLPWPPVVDQFRAALGVPPSVGPPPLMPMVAPTLGGAYPIQTAFAPAFAPTALARPLVVSRSPVVLPGGAVPPTVAAAPMQQPMLSTMPRPRAVPEPHMLARWHDAPLPRPQGAPSPMSDVASASASTPMLDHTPAPRELASLAPATPTQPTPAAQDIGSSWPWPPLLQTSEDLAVEEALGVRPIRGTWMSSKYQDAVIVVAGLVKWPNGAQCRIMCEGGTRYCIASADGGVCRADLVEGVLRWEDGDAWAFKEAG